MNESQKKWIPIFLIVLGICFVVIGVWQQETADVFRKAVNICMECIGLG